jgi:serine/threonine protein kinase
MCFFFFYKLVKYFQNISHTAKNFIQICLTKNVTKRPSAKGLLTHEWFRSLHSELESQTPSLNILTRLILFHKKSELTKLCMEVVAHTLNSKQIENLRIQFKLLDKNNSGEILLSDLKNVLQRQSNISAANLEIMFGAMDGFDQTTSTGGVGGGSGVGGTAGEDTSKTQLKIKYHEFLAATLSRQNITENNSQIFFSGTTLYETDQENYKKHVIVKQVNVMPKINYCYFFNKEFFYNFFYKKNFNLIFESKNTTDNVNFKNFIGLFKNIEYKDFLFKKD